MSSLPNLKRWLAVALTAAVFVAILLIAGNGGSAKPTVGGDADQGGTFAESSPEHPMFGGTPQRNMVNTGPRICPSSGASRRAART